jgi:hypothetical protein
MEEVDVGKYLIENKNLITIKNDIYIKKKRICYGKQ